MTPPLSAPGTGLISDLPATHAGLWTAITMTHEVAMHLADMSDPASSERLHAIAQACADAAESLAQSCADTLEPTRDLPSPWIPGPERLPLVSALASTCIDLAVELLANEEEPLTPVEVLAVTRAVTALCAARSLTEAGAE